MAISGAGCPSGDTDGVGNDQHERLLIAEADPAGALADQPDLEGGQCATKVPCHHTDRCCASGGHSFRVGHEDIRF